MKFGKEIKTKDIIRDYDLIIAEVSLPSTGLGIELGWADMYQIPILCIYKRRIEPSKSLHYVTNNFISYENEEDMIKQIEMFIEKV